MFPTSLSHLLGRLLPSQPIPGRLKPVILHLFLDMAWIGLLSGTTIAFLSVYAARLGASASQVGLLSAAPAAINLLFAIPSGQIIRGRNLADAAFWSSVAARVFYCGLIFLPVLFSAEDQVWAIIVIILVMNIPLTVLNVSFNAMVIEVVPAEYRAYVVGGRNGLLAIVSLVSTLLSGYILNASSFPDGYRIIFGLGFLGAAMSSLHLFFLRKFASNPNQFANRPARKQPQKWTLLFVQEHLHNSKYARILILLFCFHIAQWLVIPIVPLFSVNHLQLNDLQIGIGSAVFNLVVFVGSFFLARITSRLGNHRSTAFSVMGMGIFPIVLGLSQGFPLFVTAQFIGGISWSILAGAMFNYLAENVPEDNRAESMSWYILISNGSILIGSLVGPVVATRLGYPIALILFAVLRIISGLSILRWG